MIILTGSSGGIANAIVNDLAKLDNVICLYNQNKPLINKKNVKHYKIDLRNENEIIKFTDTVNEKKIILINMAAIYIDKLIINLTSNEFDNHYDINIRAVFLLSKYLLPKMVRNKYGKILMISSPATKLGHVGTGGYSSSKSALMTMSNVIANEYEKFNIQSNTLMLGYYDTGIYKKLSLPTRKKLLEEIPTKSLGKITDIVKAIKELISKDDINGKTIYLDDGIIIKND